MAQGRNGAKTNLIFSYPRSASPFLTDCLNTCCCMHVCGMSDYFGSLPVLRLLGPANPMRWLIAAYSGPSSRVTSYPCFAADTRSVLRRGSLRYARLDRVPRFEQRRSPSLLIAAELSAFRARSLGFYEPVVDYESIHWPKSFQFHTYTGMYGPRCLKNQLITKLAPRVSCRKPRPSDPSR